MAGRKAKPRAKRPTKRTVKRPAALGRERARRAPGRPDCSRLRAPRPAGRRHASSAISSMTTVRSAKSGSVSRKRPSGSFRRRIEAGRDQHQVRLEGFGGGQQPILERAQDLLAARPGREGQFKVAPSPSPYAGFRGCAGAGIPRRLMGAEEEDRAVGIEDVLRAVAVMDVPIGDQHPAHAMVSSGHSGRRRRRC